MKKIWKIAFLAAVAAAIFIGMGICVSAEEYGILTYDILNNETEVNITGTTDKYITSVTIPEKISGLPVVSIGSYAFKDCEYFESVTIPDSVTEIGDDAFHNCVLLNNVVFGQSIKTIGKSAFENCDSLKTITIPNSVTEIGEYAFCDCDVLSNVVLSKSLKTINSSAFENCNALKSITIPDEVTEIGGHAFSDCDLLSDVVLGLSVRTIGTNAFYNCDSMKTITIPDNVTEIGYGAFANCDLLTTATLGQSLRNIDGYAFSGCRLTEVTIPDSVTKIGDHGFEDCDFLINLVFGQSLRIIGEYAFYDCDRLSTITIPDSVTEIGSFAFSKCNNLINIGFGQSVRIIGEFAFENCDRLKSIKIPDSVTIISDGAFKDCDLLSDVVLGQSVMTIGSEAFYNCDSLINITIPDNVTEISDHTFDNCSKLSEVILGENVSIIGVNAFADCSMLSSVKMGKWLKTIEWGAFAGCDKLETITIPDNVTEIKPYAFSGCDMLTDVIIGSSIIRIGDYAFRDCERLVSASFKGDAPLSSNFGSDVFSGTASDFTIYYISGKTGWTNPWNGYNTAVWDGTDTPSTKSKAIIVVPGITGSELYGYRNSKVVPVWNVDSLLDISNLNSTLEALSDELLVCKSDGSSEYDIYAYNETDSPYGMLNTYKDLVLELKKNFEPEYSVHFFGYDWRLTNKISASKLNDYISENNYNEVILVAHSMGGIVSSLYIDNYDPDMQIVKKLITLGTPYGGSPKALKALVNGHFLDHIPYLDNKLLKKNIQNTPGVYELLPNYVYFLNSYYYLKLYNDDKLTEIRDEESTNRYITLGLGKNSALLSNSVEMYTELKDTYDKITSSNANSYFIIGYNTLTICTLQPQPKDKTGADQAIISDLDVEEKGDGTVPLISSTMNGKVPSNRSYYVNGVDHTGLASDTDCIKLVVNIISEKNVSNYENEYSSKIYRGDMTDKIRILKFCGYKVVAACPVDLTIYDKDGNWLGTATSDKIETAEGYEYNFYTCGLDDEIKIAFVDDYANIKIEGYDEGTMDMVIEKYEDDVLVDVISYTNVDITDDTVITTNTNITESPELVVQTDTETYTVNPDMTADIDLDGTPGTPADAMYLARYLAGWDGYSVSLTTADLDGDGAVTLRDAVILARHIAGWTGYETLPYWDGQP